MRALLPPFPDWQCPRASMTGGGPQAFRAPCQLDPPIPQRTVAVPRDMLPPRLPSRAFQGRPASPPSPALAPPPLACRSRVGGCSRQTGIPPQSAAWKREGEGGERGGELRNWSGNVRSVFLPRSRIPTLVGMPQNPLIATLFPPTLPSRPEPFPPPLAQEELLHPWSSWTTTPASL